LTLLVGIALLLWTAVGHAMAEAEPSVRLPCKRKGPRRSLLQVGIRFLAKLAQTVVLGVAFIRAHWPAPKLRIFTWLQTAEGAL
jgi:hypothetical protein